MENINLAIEFLSPTQDQIRIPFHGRVIQEVMMMAPLTGLKARAKL
jgi:hypothetical protein